MGQASGLAISGRDDGVRGTSCSSALPPLRMLPLLPGCRDSLNLQASPCSRHPLLICPSSCSWEGNSDTPPPASSPCLAPHCSQPAWLCPSSAALSPGTPSLRAAIWWHWSAELAGVCSSGCWACAHHRSHCQEYSSPLLHPTPTHPSSPLRSCHAGSGKRSLSPGLDRCFTCHCLGSPPSQHIVYRPLPT